MVAKEEICHFIKDAGLPEANEEEERPIEPPLSYLPRFPEVTITPACSIIQHCGTAEGAALGPSMINSNFNLATPMKPQEMTELPVEPSQYDSLNALLPLDYGYCLEDNLCMHPSGTLHCCGHNGIMEILICNRPLFSHFYIIHISQLVQNSILRLT